MIRRVTMLITVLALVFATAGWAAAADADCTLVGVGAETRERRAESGGVQDPTGVCEMLTS